VAVLGLAVVGLGWGVREAARVSRSAEVRQAWWPTAVFALIGLAILADVAVLAALFVNGRLTISWFGDTVMIQNADRFLAALAVLVLTLVALVPRARAFVRGAPQSAFGFFACMLGASAMLALGPRLMAAGRFIGLGPYYWLYRYVPGFDGLRVPARYEMIAALALAVLAGFGAAAIVAKWRAFGFAIIGVASVAILAEAWIVPMRTNLQLTPVNYALEPDRLATGRHVSPIYRFLRDAPDRVVLAEFPFGDPAYDILATFYAGYHRRPILNGYSGFFPKSYELRQKVLGGIPADPEASSRALRSYGATYALVHEEAFVEHRGREVSIGLVQAGARLVMTDGGDKLFALGDAARPAGPGGSQP
jgi:hypothetical protein